MSEYRRVSRADKHTKRRNNKRKLLFFVSLAAVFIVILFSLIALGNKDKDDETKEKQPETEEVSLNDENKEESENNEANTVSPKAEENGDETDIDDVDEIGNVDDVVIQQVESTDENVLEAYTGNWAPIGTVQQGPHTTNYNDGSDDRNEIKRAVSAVTGIGEANMIEHWVGNGGEQKVIATVSNKQSNEFYNVYLSWVDEEGWQVTRVERIKQFQKKAGD